MSPSTRRGSASSSTNVCRLTSRETSSVSRASFHWMTWLSWQMTSWPPSQLHHNQQPQTSLTVLRFNISLLVSQLALKVDALKEQLHNQNRQCFSSPWHYHQRSRSSSSPRHSPVVCYYHKRFGQDARKCTKSCSF